MQLMKSVRGNLAHFKRWGSKKALAFIKWNGLELAQVRRRGSRRVATRLLRAAGSALACPATPISLDPARFFTVEIEARPGINHLRLALELLIREAASLGRTPVVFKPWFDPRHNLGHDLDVTWDKYIDLARIEISCGSARAVTVRALQHDEVPGIDHLSTAWFDRDHLVTEEENRSFDLIVRRNRTGLHIEAVHGAGFDLPGRGIRFVPSALVLEKFGVVKGRLGNYVAMHVRRDDMLEMTDLYPNLGRDTQPAHILQTLLKHVPRQCSIYIMTNERDKRFFDALRAEFEIFQYFDFPVLREIIEAATPDNFLLFEIEKLLFDAAPMKIHTFTHPEGGKRIALTTDKGWA